MPTDAWVLHEHQSDSNLEGVSRALMRSQESSSPNILGRYLPVSMLINFILFVRAELAVTLAAGFGAVRLLHWTGRNSKHSHPSHHL